MKNKQIGQIKNTKKIKNEKQLKNLTDEKIFFLF